MTLLQIDLETYSSYDLKKTGVHRYVEAPDFEILLFAFAFDDDPVEVIDLTAGEDFPDEVMLALRSDVVKTAWNAAFERTAIAKRFGIDCDPNYWRCSMAHAYTLGLPGSLEKAAVALGLEEQKDNKGKNLIRYFSVPCKPTKVNGGRTRNLPYHAPERWQDYIEYNRQDVVVEREVRKRLERFPVPDREWKLWAIDQKINDLGVKVDRELVDQAIDFSNRYTDQLVQEAKELTGVDNPNSLQQIKAWFAEHGMQIESLGKDHMPALLEAAPDEDTKRMLELRQEMGKTSVKKYEAIKNSVCDDSRVRGILQYCGASRTWRWAGRRVQMHNLPQNHLPDLDDARSTLKSGDYDWMEMLYGRIPFVLSELIRTALIPAEGHRFIVSDFSAIEARVIAWLADEMWVLEVFKDHGKIYEATASRMFGIPFETIVRGHENYKYRAPGKVATLACIAEGELVLTDVGLIPIEEITTEHLVWDGKEWVEHEGVIYKGKKRVLSYDGLTATPDHLVWVEGESEPIHFGDAAASGKRLVQSGTGRDPVWVGEDYQPRKTLPERLAPVLCADSVCELQTDPVVLPVQSDSRGVERLSEVLSAKKDPGMAGSETHCRKTTLHESKRSGVHQLRGKGDRVPVPIDNRSGIMDHRQPWASGKAFGVGSDKQQRTLRAGEPKVGGARDAEQKQEDNSYHQLGPERMALCVHNSCAEAVSGDVSGRDHRRSSASRYSQTEKLENHCEEVRVYDIVNAGPRNRFTVSGKLVHNCGFGGGPNALASMDKKKEIPEDEYPGLVRQWRDANPRIRRLWYRAEEAAMEAVRTKSTVKLAHGVRYRYSGGMLFADLPSGHSLTYPAPEIRPDPKFDGKEGLVFKAPNGTGQMIRQRTWGGTLVENLVQGIARDCLAESLLRLDAAGFKIPLHVHDEVVLEMPNGFGSVDEVAEIMSQPIDWAPGLPLDAEGFECEFYQKD